MELLNYDVKNGTHRSAEEEWAPHKTQAPNSFEWHYITAPLKGDNGHNYFMYLCDFNFNSKMYRMAGKKMVQGGFPTGLVPIMETTNFCDYDDDLYLDGHGLACLTPEQLYDEKTNTIRIKDTKNLPEFDVEFQYKGDRVYVKAKTPIYECELDCTGASRVMWMKDTLGKEGFIREGGRLDRSFYYSLPELPITGWIKYTNKAGELVTVNVTGEGWVDRQWGDFMTMSWEWTSFRFDDGDRINCYNFGSGHQVFTYQDKAGNTVSYPKFYVVQNGYLRTPVDTWVSWGWDYYIPVKEGFYTLTPVSNKNICVSEINTFFEGVSEITDKSGKKVGVAVTESMNVKLMHNGTNDKFNNFPPKGELDFGNPL